MTKQFYKRTLSSNRDENINATDIKNNFFIRLHEFETIRDEIHRNAEQKFAEHYLILGESGSGKSTLLRRIQADVETDIHTKQQFFVVYPAEEQANIYRLYDLLEEIIQELQYQGVSTDQIEWKEDERQYTRELFTVIHKAIHLSGKKIILLLDNINRIFENIGRDTALLREYLLNYGNIRIIGSNNKKTEHFYNYDQPFYHYFRVIKLDTLTPNDVNKLLLGWSKTMNLPQLKIFAKEYPGQLETIRILTDGTPGTFRLFANVFACNAQQTAYNYLSGIMNQVSPLFKERLYTLPASQRKMVHQMALHWEAIGTGKLAEVCHMNNNIVSAQLKQLTDKGIVEKIDSGNKNHLYRLTERFFNLWLIFTQGNAREKRRIKHLVLFLENFYNEQNNQAASSKNKFQKANHIIKNVSRGNFTNLKEDVLACIENNIEQSEFLLTNLMLHRQFNLVYQLFDTSPVANRLQEHFSPLYYAVLKLKPQQEKAILKMPPEIKSTVDEVLERMKVLRKLLHPNDK